jgi:hypothetical protein
VLDRVRNQLGWLIRLPGMIRESADTFRADRGRRPLSAMVEARVAR